MSRTALRAKVRKLYLTSNSRLVEGLSAFVRGGYVSDNSGDLFVDNSGNRIIRLNQTETVLLKSKIRKFTLTTTVED